MSGESSFAKRSFWLRRDVMAVVLVGLLLRVLYVSMATVEFPIRGDVNQYVLYAWNLSHRGTFSSARPDAADALPDSYRGPGYPALLAACMLAAGSADLPLRAGPDGTIALGYQSDAWMRIAIAAQVVLGTLSILLTIAIARLWLADRWALLAGAVVAVWPHLVVFTGVLLSETLFAFLLLLSLWLLCSALDRNSRARMALAGLTWGAAYLVNPVVALFPLAAAGVCRARRRVALAGVLVLAFVLAPGAWALRNAFDASGANALQRVEENFVQGSWPQYHAAENSRFDNAISRRIVDAIDAETERLKTEPRAGMAEIAGRLATAPGFYLAWYLIEKPYLLWDWRIRVGAGDIYFLPTAHSPFAVIPILRWFERLCMWFNPLLFALGAGAAAGVLVAGFRRGAPTAAPVVVLALLAIYLTAVHVVLQAEPRYSIPYRPVEILLAVTAAAQLARYAAAWRARRSTRPALETGGQPPGASQ